jgi:hypothetical protein
VASPRPSPSSVFHAGCCPGSKPSARGTVFGRAPSGHEITALVEDGRQEEILTKLTTFKKKSIYVPSMQYLLPIKTQRDQTRAASGPEWGGANWAGRVDAPPLSWALIKTRD